MSATTKLLCIRPVAALLAAGVLLAPAAAAQPRSGERPGEPAGVRAGVRVGEVAWVQGNVTGTPAGGTAAALAASDPVLIAEELVTAERSGAGLAFEPRGALTLDPGSRLVVDRDVYDEATGESESAVSLLLGKARLFLSSAFHGSFSVDTPAATIGVKGTALVVGVLPDGTTQVWVLEGGPGDVTVSAKGGRSVPLDVGFTTTVAPGRAPTPPVPFDTRSGVAGAVALPLPLPPLPPVPEDLPTEQKIDDQPPGRGDGGTDDPGSTALTGGQQPPSVRP